MVIVMGVVGGGGYGTVQVSEMLNAFCVTYAYITRVHDYFTRNVVIVYAYETQYVRT